MKGFIGALFIFFLLIFVFYFTNNYSKLFLPSKKLSDYRILPTEEVVVNGLSINAFWNDKNSKTILFCHGNYGNITNRNYMINFAESINYNLVLFDYFGYGKSFGRPTTHKILKNADTVLEWTLDRVDPKNIIIWGESLGGSTASYLASKHKCHKLILFSTFPSLDELALGNKQDFWFIKLIKVFFGFIMNLLPVKYWVNETSCSTLIVHSTEDELISYDLTKEICKSDPERIKLLSIKGGHSSPIVTEDNINEILDFCDIKFKENIAKYKQIFDNIKFEEW